MNKCDRCKRAMALNSNECLYCSQESALEVNLAVKKSAKDQHASQSFTEGEKWLVGAAWGSAAAAFCALPFIKNGGVWTLGMLCLVCGFLLSLVGAGLFISRGKLGAFFGSLASAAANVVIGILILVLSIGSH